MRAKRKGKDSGGRDVRRQVLKPDNGAAICMEHAYSMEMQVDT